MERHGQGNESPDSTSDQDSLEEHTVVVDRDVPEERTVLVDRDSPGEHTVVVNRAALEEHTVVVNRAALEEHTVVVDRDSPEEHTVLVDRDVPGEHTVVVDRDVPEEHTVVVDRGAKPESRLAVLGVISRRARRRDLTPAPGGAAAQRTSVVASGPGAVSTYSPRAIPQPPLVAPKLESGPDASRLDAPSMPSVRRQSRRFGRTTLAIAAAACVVSVTGIVVVILALVTG